MEESLEIQLLSLQGESFSLPRVPLSVTGRELHELIVQSLPKAKQTKLSAELVVHKGAEKLCLKKTLKEQGFIATSGEALSLSYVYVPVKVIQGLSVWLRELPVISSLTAQYYSIANCLKEVEIWNLRGWPPGIFSGLWCETLHVHSSTSIWIGRNMLIAGGGGDSWTWLIWWRDLTWESLGLSMNIQLTAHILGVDLCSAQFHNTTPASCRYSLAVLLIPENNSCMPETPTPRVDGIRRMG